MFCIIQEICLKHGRFSIRIFLTRKYVERLRGGYHIDMYHCVFCVHFHPVFCGHQRWDYMNNSGKDIKYISKVYQFLKTKERLPHQKN